MLICMQKINLIPLFFFLEIFQRYHKLAILVNLVMPGYDFQKNFHFALFLGKTNGKIFKKCKIYFWALSTQIWAKTIFPQNCTLSLFIIYSSLTSWKKSEKTNEPILRKTLN